jgi:hypothetical protein
MYSLMFVFALGVLQMWATPAMAADEPAKVAGTWEMSSEGPNGTMTQTLEIQQDGGTLKGTITGRRGPAPLEGTITGNKLSFSVKRQTQDGSTMVMDYTATVSGDSLTGKVHSERFGDRDFTAKRTK